jgi:hypothetical protein
MQTPANLHFALRLALLPSHVLEIVTLQGLDAEAAILRDTLVEVERKLAGDEALDLARAALEEAESAVAASQRDQRRLDGEIAGYTAKTEPEEKRLYDGSVKNPKELGNIQREVESLKAARGKLEDELLELLARLETESALRATLAAQLAAQEARRAAELVSLQSEATRLGGLIAAAEAKSQVQRLKVPPVSARLYDEVRRRKGGMAIARITGGTCGGCRISLPDQLRRRALNSEIPAQCPNCDRILYVG